MSKIKIGVIRGGPSSEYDVSLKTGENVLKFLPEKYEGIDILIDKRGVWHFDGRERTLPNILSRVDLIFNALHGEFGEDGKIQQILEFHKIPFTGSGSYTSAIAMNKFLAKDVLKNAGIKMARGFLIRKDDDLDIVVSKIFKNFSPPWVLKPVNKGSSVGVEIINKFDDLKKNIDWIFLQNDKILFEEYIKGREATCGILENFRGEKYYALPPIEIVPPEKNNFFDYEAKYSGETREICPANFDLKIKREIENLARKVHLILGCKAYSRSDFMVSSRGIFFLETNTLPGLTSESLLPKSAAVAGLNFGGLLEHIIKSAV